MFSETDGEIARRIYRIIEERFSGWFSAKWVCYEYGKQYPEITTKKVSATLEAMNGDGYLQVRVVGDRRCRSVKFHRQRLSGTYRARMQTYIPPSENVEVRS